MNPDYTLLVQMSLSYDNDMKRTPQFDDWIEDDIGYVPEEIIHQFARNRHPKAFKILLFDKKGKNEASKT